MKGGPERGRISHSAGTRRPCKPLIKSAVRCSTPLQSPTVKDLLEARHRVINESAGAAKLGRRGAREVGGTEIKGACSTMQSTHRSNKARVRFGTT